MACPARPGSAHAVLLSPQAMQRPGLFGRLKAAVVGMVHVGALPGKRRGTARPVGPGPGPGLCRRYHP